jgi:hypothetical protein
VNSQPAPGAALASGSTMKNILLILAVGGAAWYFLRDRQRRSISPAERIRAALPNSVRASIRNGVVLLRGGPVPQDDLDRMLTRVLAMPGVTEVISYVETQPPEDIPGLQLGMPRSPARA